MGPLLLLNVCSWSYSCSPPTMKWCLDSSMYFYISDGKCTSKYWPQKVSVIRREEKRPVYHQMTSNSGCHHRVWVYLFTRHLSVLLNTAKRPAYLHTWKEPVAGDLMRGFQSGDLKNRTRILSEPEPVAHVQMKVRPCQQRLKQSTRVSRLGSVSTRLPAARWDCRNLIRVEK